MCLLLSCDQKKNNLRFYEVFGVKLVELMKVCQRNCSNFSQGIFIVLWIAKNWKRRFLGRGILSNFTKTRKRTKKNRLGRLCKIATEKIFLLVFLLLIDKIFQDGGRKIFNQNFAKKSLLRENLHLRMIGFEETCLNNFKECLETWQIDPKSPHHPKYWKLFFFYLLSLGCEMKSRETANTCSRAACLAFINDIFDHFIANLNLIRTYIFSNWIFFRPKWNFLLLTVENPEKMKTNHVTEFDKEGTTMLEFEWMLGGFIEVCCEFEFPKF